MVRRQEGLEPASQPRPRPVRTQARNPPAHSSRLPSCCGRRAFPVSERTARPRCQDAAPHGTRVPGNATITGTHASTEKQEQREKEGRDPGPWRPGQEGQGLKTEWPKARTPETYTRETSRAKGLAVPGGVVQCPDCGPDPARASYPAAWASGTHTRDQLTVGPEEVTSPTRWAGPSLRWSKWEEGCGGPW